MSNNARVTVTSHGEERVLKDVPLDPFRALLLSPSGPRATVSISVGKSLAFGELKVSANVTLQCDQDQATIDRAGEKAFVKAVEFLDDAFKLLVPEAAT